MTTKNYMLETYMLLNVFCSDLAPIAATAVEQDVSLITQITS